MAPTPIHAAVLVDAWFPFTGGGQVHVQNLTQALKKHSVRSALYYPPRPDIFTRALWSLIVPFQIALHHQTKKRFHLIHSHGFNSALAGKLASLLTGLPQVHTVHGSHLMDQADTSPKGRLEQFLLTGIAYPAQITVARHFKAYPNATKHIHHIPNGVDIEAFRDNPVKAARPTVIFVGRRHPDKGLDTLEAAFDLVQKQIPSAQLKLVTGNLRGKELIRAYLTSHVFVLPSRAEGQPITLLEAWAAKLPVIVTRVGDNPHMVKDGNNGYLVKPDDPSTLAKKIIYLLNHPGKAHQLGERGHQLVKNRYTWDRIASQTYQVYQSLLE